MTAIPIIAPTLGYHDRCTVIQRCGEYVRFIVVRSSHAPLIREQWGSGIYGVPGEVRRYKNKP